MVAGITWDSVSSVDWLNVVGDPAAERVEEEEGVGAGGSSSVETEDSWWR